MPKIVYNHRLSFKDRAQNLLVHAITIIEEYEGQGYVMTLRQLFYQLVARDIIPNEQKEYDRLGDIIKRGRLAGYIDWNSIVDRTRNLEETASWTSPQDILVGARNAFKLDPWKDQQFHQEVWIEKDALIGAIEDKCQELRIPYFSCRGYTSISEVWAAGQRILNRIVNEKRPTVIFHLGDHDPAGVDMTRDIYDRINMFVKHHLERILGKGEADGIEVPVERLALNMDQIEEYEPPPNPVKFSDSKAAKYVERFETEQSWELDALPPNVLQDLIQEAWDEWVDRKEWDAVLDREEEHREVIAGMVDNFDRIGKSVARWTEADKKKQAKKKTRKKVSKKKGKKK